MPFRFRFIELCRSPALFVCIVLLMPFLFNARLTGSGDPSPAEVSPASRVRQAQETEQSPNASAPSYLEEPLETLIQSVPELRTLEPSNDQTALPIILEKTGQRVDGLFNQDFINLKATEVISESEVTVTTKPIIQEDQYDYFILRSGNLLQTNFAEYRRGAKENEITPAGDFFLSSGFAKSVLYFSKAFQRESKYRYLGVEMIGRQSAYVVAFAPIPSKATVNIKARRADGLMADVLVQGIAWVDRNNFQILQMRSDLLTPKIHIEVENNPYWTKTKRLDGLRTLITFSEVQPQGIETSMWLPNEADVRTEIQVTTLSTDSAIAGPRKSEYEKWFRNTHRYTNYRLCVGPQDRSANVNESVQKNDEEAHPYLEEPPKQLVKRIPELKGIRPAPSQQALGMILRRTGERVDEFFANLPDIIAREEITQQRQISGNLPSGMPGGLFLAQEKVQDDYLILRHGDGAQARISEFRMDSKGNRMDTKGNRADIVVVSKGFFATSGFALSSVHFSTVNQWDSRFLYLGDQKIKGRDTYVVAFAQLPAEARNKITMTGRSGITVQMLAQGIAWVDKEDFHIVRMQTDLLARQPQIGLDAQTTKVAFAEVRFPDVPVPLWLPRDANVYIKFTDPSKLQDLGNSVPAFGISGEDFRNIHHYTNYRRYRVATKMLTPQ